MATKAIDVKEEQETFTLRLYPHILSWGVTRRIVERWKKEVPIEHRYYNASVKSWTFSKLVAPQVERIVREEANMPLTSTTPPRPKTLQHTYKAIMQGNEPVPLPWVWQQGVDRREGESEVEWAKRITREAVPVTLILKEEELNAAQLRYLQLYGPQPPGRICICGDRTCTIGPFLIEA